MPDMSFKATTRSQIGSNQYLYPISAEANLAEKNRKIAGFLELTQADLLLPRRDVARKGRLPDGPGAMQRVSIKALTANDRAQTTGPDIPVNRGGFIKAVGWSEGAYPAKARSSEPGVAVATGEMPACISVGFKGDGSHGTADGLRSMVSVMHIYPLNGFDEVEASIAEEAATMRARGLVPSAGLAGGDKNNPWAVAMETVVRASLANETVPIEAAHDKAGEKRDGWDSSFVQAAVVDSNNKPHLGNTLRIVD